MTTAGERRAGKADGRVQEASSWSLARVRQPSFFCCRCKTAEVLLTEQLALRRARKPGTGWWTDDVLNGGELHTDVEPGSILLHQWRWRIRPTSFQGSKHMSLSCSLICRVWEAANTRLCLPTRCARSQI